MPKLPQVCLFLCLTLLAQPARAEPVYDFVIHCKQEPLGQCFQLIQDRLIKLNAGATRRICLPRAFGTTMFGSVGVPVSVLEHVRLGLSSARFGSAGDDVDDTIATIVNSIYPCE